MCFHPARATASRRRAPHRRRAPSSPLAVLDMSRPGERQAHDFLARATSKRDGMWRLITLRRFGDALLCVVRWTHAESLTMPFSLAKVKLAETAVYWRDYPSADAARDEMERRCAVPTIGERGA